MYLPSSIHVGLVVGAAPSSPPFSCPQFRKAGCCDANLLLGYVDNTITSPPMGTFFVPNKKTFLPNSFCIFF